MSRYMPPHMRQQTAPVRNRKLKYAHTPLPVAADATLPASCWTAPDSRAAVFREHAAPPDTSRSSRDRSGWMVFRPRCWGESGCVPVVPVRRVQVEAAPAVEAVKVEKSKKGRAGAGDGARAGMRINTAGQKDTETAADAAADAAADEMTPPASPASEGKC